MKAELKVITSKKDYRLALRAIEERWDSRPGTEAHDLLEALAVLVEDYERRTFPMEALIPRRVLGRGVALAFIASRRAGSGGCSGASSSHSGCSG